VTVYLDREFLWPLFLRFFNAMQGERFYHVELSHLKTHMADKRDSLEDENEIEYIEDQLRKISTGIIPPGSSVDEEIEQLLSGLL
jgi:hypothetical protein